MSKIAANLIMINKAVGEKEKEAYYTRIYRELKLPKDVDYQYNLLYINFLNSLEEGQDEKAKDLLAELEVFIDDNNYGHYTKGILYNNLGMRYGEREQYDSALVCYRKAVSILDTSSYLSNLQSVYGNMCAVFSLLGEEDSVAFYRGND